MSQFKTKQEMETMIAVCKEDPICSKNMDNANIGASVFLIFLFIALVFFIRLGYKSKTAINDNYAYKHYYD